MDEQSKLKSTDVRQYRESLLLKQNRVCLLCEKEINDDDVLDHDHKSGHCGAVLRARGR